jgi:4-carboxymuconolactone decarboxylase
MIFKLTNLEDLPEEVLTELNSYPKINIYKNFAQGYHRGFKAFCDLAATFYTEESKVHPRLREIGILRIAGNTKSEYEAHHHTNLAKNCGVTEKECEIIISEKRVDELSDEENLVCKVADEFCNNFKLSDETFEEFYSAFETEKAIEIATCLSMYIQIACIISALKVEIEDVNPLENLKKPT